MYRYLWISNSDRVMSIITAVPYDLYITTKALTMSIDYLANWVKNASLTRSIWWQNLTAGPSLRSMNSWTAGKVSNSNACPSMSYNIQVNPCKDITQQHDAQNFQNAESVILQCLRSCNKNNDIFYILDPRILSFYNPAIF